MNEKGQALIEFVIILPILLFLILMIFDFGNMFYKKSQLENDLDFIVELYQDNNMEEINNYVNNNNLVINYNNVGEFVIIELSKQVSIKTPGLNLIFKEPYYVITKRYLYE